MEEWLVYKEFRFEAAHKLPNHNGKCCRLHGHSWVGRVYVKGDRLIDSGVKQGMVIDYGDIKKYIKPLLDKYLDHYYLNESLAIKNPTSEMVAEWIYEKLETAGLSGLDAVEIRKTYTSGCNYKKTKL